MLYHASPVNYKKLDHCGKDPVSDHFLQKGNWVCQRLSSSWNLSEKGEPKVGFLPNFSQRVNNGSWNGVMDLCVKPLTTILVGFLREEKYDHIWHKTE